MSALLTLTLMNKLMSLYRLCLPSDVQREMNDQITFSFKMYIDIFNKKDVVYCYLQVKYESVP